MERRTHTDGRGFALEARRPCWPPSDAPWRETATERGRGGRETATEMPRGVEAWVGGARDGGGINKDGTRWGGGRFQRTTRVTYNKMMVMNMDLQEGAALAEPAVPHCAL